MQNQRKIAMRGVCIS